MSGGDEGQWSVHSRLRASAWRRYRRSLCVSLLLLLAGGAAAKAQDIPRPRIEAPPMRRERPEAFVRAIYAADRAATRPPAGTPASTSPAEPAPAPSSITPAAWTEPDTAARLFTPSLAALAVADGRRPVADRRIGFDPFAGPLQTRTATPTLQTVSASAARAEVTARSRVTGVPTVSFRLIATQDGSWRIADIWWGGDKERSLARLLR